MAQGTAFIEAHEQAEAEQLAGDIAAARTEAKIKQAAVERAEAIAAKAKPDEQQAAIAEAGALARDLASYTVPTVQRILADDASPEKIPALLKDNGGRIAIISPEGDLFDVAGGRYNNGSPNLGVYLKAHSGDAIRVDRVGRGPEFIPRPALTIVIAAQPEVLRGLTGKPGFRGRGFLARFSMRCPRARSDGARLIRHPCRSRFAMTTIAA